MQCEHSVCQYITKLLNVETDDCSTLLKRIHLLP